LAVEILRFLPLKCLSSRERSAPLLIIFFTLFGKKETYLRKCGFEHFSVGKFFKISEVGCNGKKNIYLVKVRNTVQPEM